MDASKLQSGAAAAQAFTSLAGAYIQGRAERTRADYEAMVAEHNMRLAQLQSEDALRRGSKAANKVRQEGLKVVGAQRAATAAQGIKVDDGTAADLQAETQYLSELDAMTVQNNAWREAWGFKAQAADQQSKATFGEMAGDARANAMILTGGLQAADYAGQALYYSQQSADDKNKGIIPKPAAGRSMTDDFKMPELGSSLKRGATQYRL